MLRTLQSPWIACVIGCVIYFTTSVLVFKPIGPISRPVVEETPRFVNNEVSWKFHNPEFDQWLTELKQEKDALAVREQQLKELQAHIESQRIELTTVTQTVAQMQSEFDKTVVRFKGQETENLKRQAKLLTAMSPETAVAMLGEMGDDEVVRLLFLMKNDQTGSLLETMSKLGKTETKRATMLTERLRLVLPAAPETGARTNAL